MNLTDKVNRVIELAAQAAASDSPKAKVAAQCAREARDYMAGGRLSAAAYRAAKGVEAVHGWKHADAREAFRLYDEVSP